MTVHGVSLTQQVSTYTNNYKPKCCCNCNSTFLAILPLFMIKTPFPFYVHLFLVYVDFQFFGNLYDIISFVS